MTVDWKAFRVAAATAGVTEGREKRLDYKQALSGTDAGKLEEALAAAQAAIARNMADGEAHLLAARVLEKMFRLQEAERERAVEHALVMSIYGSGDGKTQASALVVVDAAEETFFSQSFLGEEPTAHEVMMVDGKSYDRATVVDWEGKKSDVWFLRLVGVGKREKKS